MDGWLPGGGRADTDYSELGSRRAGFLRGYGRGNRSHPPAPGTRGAADPALTPGSAPRAAKGPGAGSCSLSPIHWDLRVCTHPGTQNLKADPGGQVGAREPDPGQESERKQTGPGEWREPLGEGERGGSLRALAARGAARRRSSFQGEKMDFSAATKFVLLHKEVH